MSDESMEMCEWFESIIEDMIKEYQREYVICSGGRAWNEGAVDALEELLKRIKE